MIILLCGSAYIFSLYVLLNNPEALSLKIHLLGVREIEVEEGKAGNPRSMECTQCSYQKGKNNEQCCGLVAD
jgi:hypothetical protein